jgi:hypothetical protein
MSDEAALPVAAPTATEAAAKSSSVPLDEEIKQRNLNNAVHDMFQEYMGSLKRTCSYSSHT